jgi:ABC-type multidrug transport system fused ATPase/permease subunit
MLIGRANRGDLIGSCETIQILQQEAKATADHDRVMCNGQDPENDLIDWSSISDITQEAIFSLGLYLLVQQAITGIADNDIKPVDISALYTLAIQLQKRLGTLGDSFRRTLKYWVVGCRVFDIMGETSTTSDLEDAVELFSCQGNVEFQNVGFAYIAKPVLRNISFVCRPGETVVFVGKSGAGKSTIRKLLFRNYHPQNGCIFIDGQDIRKLTRRVVATPYRSRPAESDTS